MRGWSPVTIRTTDRRFGSGPNLLPDLRSPCGTRSRSRMASSSTTQDSMGKEWIMKYTSGGIGRLLRCAACAARIGQRIMSECLVEYGIQARPHREGSDGTHGWFLRRENQESPERVSVVEMDRRGTKKFAEIDRVRRPSKPVVTIPKGHCAPKRKLFSEPGRWAVCPRRHERDGGNGRSYT